VPSGMELSSFEWFTAQSRGAREAIHQPHSAPPVLPVSSILLTGKRVVNERRGRLRRPGGRPVGVHAEAAAYRPPLSVSVRRS